MTGTFPRRKKRKLPRSTATKILGRKKLREKNPILIRLVTNQPWLVLAGEELENRQKGNESRWPAEKMCLEKSFSYLVSRIFHLDKIFSRGPGGIDKEGIWVA